MEEKNRQEKELALETIITSAIKIPGVKVSRAEFLAEIFPETDPLHEMIQAQGPVEAGVSQENLRSLAEKLILKRTSQSSAASFVAGIPGGFTMAATIPLDVAQFFGMALRLAQELSYLYGAQDLWAGDKLDDERVHNQLLLYCGVMFGVSGAVSGVRVLSTQIAKVTLKKLPQKALTKTFWYPILKQIGKGIGLKVTKSTVAKGVSKAIPVVGGVISGTLNFASMMPMAKRLLDAFDSASFGYTQEDFEQDLDTIEAVCDEETTEETPDFRQKVIRGGKEAISRISGMLTRKETGGNGEQEDVYASIRKLSALRDEGILTDEEFSAKKSELLARL